MRSKAIAPYNSEFSICLYLDLKIKDTLKPLQADIGVGISRFGVSLVPTRSWVRCQLAQWVDAGQMIIGSRYLPSTFTYSTAVTTVRFARAPL